MVNVGRKGCIGFANIRITELYYVHKWNPNGDMETMEGCIAQKLV
jgi:hypothetical protein